MSNVQKFLFRGEDELMFKRQFAIQFLASLDAGTYLDNCTSGWKRHFQPVEDAKFLADKAWEEWREKIGLVGEIYG